MYRLILMVTIISTAVFGQLRDDAKLPNIAESLSRPTMSILPGFIDFSKIEMTHSFNSSFGSFGGGSMLLNSYVNTMRYQISDPLTLSLRLGLMNSPYNSVQNLPTFQGTQFFGGADLQYRASENMFFRLSVDRLPTQSFYYNPYYYRPISE